jgi:hypothetical protein
MIGAAQSKSAGGQSAKVATWGMAACAGPAVADSGRCIDMKRYGMWMKAVAFSLAIVGMGLTAYAKKPSGGGGSIGGCPRNIECLDVWDPVICSDGVVYSNDCYAYRACATDCVPYGGEEM